MLECGASRHRPVLSLVLLLLLVAVAGSSPAWAADTAETDQASASRPVDRFCKWGTVPGQPARNSIYLGMWSYHFLDDNDDHRTTNDLIGGVYRGCYAGTFLNSDNNRTYSVGWQRDFFTRERSDVRLDVGYRLGIMHGYESYSIGNTKLFPLFQVYADVAYRKVGLQFSWAAEVVTVGFLIRLP